MPAVASAVVSNDDASGGAAVAAPPPASGFTATTGLDSQDAWQAAKLAVRTGTDAVLEIATKTPVVGGIVQLLINAK